MQEIVMENADQEMLFSDGVGCRFPRFSDLDIISLGIRMLKIRKERYLPTYREDCIKLARFELSGDKSWLKS